MDTNSLSSRKFVGDLRNALFCFGLMKDGLTKYSERAKLKHEKEKTEEQKKREEARKKNEENLEKSWENYYNK